MNRFAFFLACVGLAGCASRDKPANVGNTAPVATVKPSPATRKPDNDCAPLAPLATYVHRNCR